jgi:hypothetical protein
MVIIVMRDYNKEIRVLKAKLNTLYEDLTSDLQQELKIIKREPMDYIEVDITAKIPAPRGAHIPVQIRKIYSYGIIEYKRTDLSGQAQNTRYNYLHRDIQLAIWEAVKKYKEDYNNCEIGL